jgi:hypothetical protein
MSEVEENGIRTSNLLVLSPVFGILNACYFFYIEKCPFFLLSSLFVNKELNKCHLINLKSILVEAMNTENPE